MPVRPRDPYVNVQTMPRRPLLIGAAVLAIAGLGLVLQRWRGAEVDVATVRRTPLVQTVVFSGRMASESRVFLGATITGRVAEVPKREAATLVRDELVVRLEDGELAATARQAQAGLQAAEAALLGQRRLAAPVATQQFIQARANAEAAERERERQEALFAQGFVGQQRVDDARRAAEVARAQLAAAGAQQESNLSGAELQQAQARLAEARAALELARARLAQARIVSPGDAVLLTRLVEPGQIVQPGTRLAELSVRSSPQLIAQVDEKFLGQLAPGQTASVVADAYPGQRFEARVASLSPLIDAQRGSVEVKFSLPAPPAFLRNDMTVSIEVATARRDQTLTVPGEALRGGTTVLVLRDGRTEMRHVKTGLRTLAAVEVTEGLSEGEQVVLEDTVLAGARVRGIEGRARKSTGNGGEAAAAAVQSMGR